MTRKKEGKRLRDIITKEILEEQLKKLSIDQIAHKYYVSNTSIRNLIKEYGIKYKAPVKLTPEILEELLIDHTIKEVCDMLNVSASTVSKLKAKMGWNYKEYYSMWKEFKEYCHNVSPKMYKKMIEMES